MTIEQINTLSLLNGLIAACGGSHYGFSAAGADSSNPTLKALFIALGEQRAGYKRELQDLGERFGGADEEAAQMEVVSGQWKPLNDALAVGDDTRVLDVLERKENAAVNAYSRALEEEKVMPDAIDVVRRQLSSIEQARDQLENLKDKLPNTATH